MIFILILEADCGRDYVRVGGICVNVSLADATHGDIATKCAEIGAQPLVTKSNAEFFQIRVSVEMAASSFILNLTRPFILRK